MCWEDDYSWKVADKNSNMELIPEGNDYRVRLKFVDHEITVDEPIELEIGLQALPSRPQPKGYHGPYWGGHPTNRPNLKFKEIPIVFADRKFGKSKLDLRVQREYLWHLWKLYLYKYPNIFQFVKFLFRRFFRSIG